METKINLWITKSAKHIYKYIYGSKYRYVQQHIQICIKINTTIHKNGRIGINKYTLYRVIPLLNSSLKLPKQSLEMPQNISTLLIKTHRKYKESRDQYRAILHLLPPDFKLLVIILSQIRFHQLSVHAHTLLQPPQLLSSCSSCSQHNAKT